MNSLKSVVPYTYSSGENSFNEDRSFESREHNYINYRQKKVKNEYIRVNCRNFWCDLKRLSISSNHRLIALVDQLYSIKTENEYLNYCTNFLLERTTHNPDYNRFIFENPLDKCIFQEFPLYQIINNKEE
ncbi:unnamed protein product [Rotaria sp. Silwood2]|nr:unnamed protein product [Rotaria sp. Silwood2]